MINSGKRYIVGVMLIAALAVSGCGKKDNPDASAVWGQADATEVSINTKIPGRLVDLYVRRASVSIRGTCWHRSMPGK